MALRTLEQANPMVLGLGDIQTDRNGGTIDGDYVNLESVDHVRCVMIAGGLGADIVWQAQQAKDNAGTGVKTITGATVTHTNGTDENTVKEVTVRASQLDVANGFTHVIMQAANPGGASTYAGIIYFMGNPRHAQATALTFTD